MLIKLTKKYKFDLKTMKFVKSTRPSLLEAVFIRLSLAHKPLYIVDIGAHMGGWTKTALKFFPNAHYTLFEPQTELVTKLEGRFSNQKIEIIPFGVGEKTEELKFTLHERLDSRSFQTSEEEATQAGFNQIILPVVSLDDYYSDKQNALPSILKIDAEGLDLNVVKGAKNILHNVEVIFIEASVMSPRMSNHLGEVICTLSELGYKLFDFTDLNRTPNQGNLWLVEAVFIKKTGKMNDFFSRFD